MNLFQNFFFYLAQPYYPGSGVAYCSHSKCMFGSEINNFETWFSYNKILGNFLIIIIITLTNPALCGFRYKKKYEGEITYNLKLNEQVARHLLTILNFF